MAGTDMRRFPWFLTVISALALGILMTLGVWQVQRLQWKSGLIARSEAAAVRPPAPLVEVLADPSPEFRRAIIDCPGLDTAPFVELQTLQHGQAGVRLISPCRPPGADATLLVDRGFVPETVSARPPVQPSARPIRVVAVVRQTPPPGLMAPPPGHGRFYARDNRAMAEALDAPQPVDERTWFAIEVGPGEWEGLSPSAPPAAFSNNHLGYALTWFGLAGVLVAFYVALLRRRGRPA